MAGQKLNLGYIVESFPSFIVNEISELRHQGATITVFNAFRPVPEKDPVKDAIRKESLYFPNNYRGVFTANLRSLFQNPLTYIKLALFLRREKESLRMLVLAAYFSRIILNQGITHLHATFGTRTTTLAYLTAKLAGIDYSFTTHAYDIFNQNPSLVWKTNNARFMRTISNFNKKFITRNYPGVDEARVLVNYLGVDLNKFGKLNDRNPNTDVFNILSAGHLMQQKGHGVLIRACGELANRGFNFRCFIAGEGAARAELERLITDLNLQDRVFLLGQLPHNEILNYLTSSHLFVLACIDMRGKGEHVDGIPVALMEAMAMGIPVVSTGISGIPELIEDGISGLLVPERDSKALADAIEKLIKEKEVRKSLGRSARKRIEEHFDLKANTHKLADMFQSTKGD